MIFLHQNFVFPWLILCATRSPKIPTLEMSSKRPAYGQVINLKINPTINNAPTMMKKVALNL